MIVMINDNDKMSWERIDVSNGKQCNDRERCSSKVKVGRRRRPETDQPVLVCRESHTDHEQHAQGDDDDHHHHGDDFGNSPISIFGGESLVTAMRAILTL